METIELSLAKSAQIQELFPDSRITGGVYTNYLNPPLGRARKILLKFADVPAEYRYRSLYSAQIKAYFYNNPSGKQTYVRPYLLRNGLDDFDPNTVSWNTVPTFYSDWIGVGYGYVFSNAATAAQVKTPKSYYTTENKAFLAKRLAKEVIWLSSELESAGSSDTIQCDLAYTNYPATLEITFDDIVVYPKIVAKEYATGYVDPHQENTFAWEYTELSSYDYCVGPWEQQSAIFYWRETGASTWNSISVGTAQQVSIAADTFPVSSIEWYVSGIVTQGTTAQSTVYTLSTTAALSYATPLSPIDVLVDSSNPVEFTWSVSNANNQTQTGADIQYSADDGSSWTQLGHAEGDVREFTVGAGAMPGGSIQWRVRSYNADGAAGPWSDPASFFYIAAPAAPIVTATEVPFTTVTWTASGQQAYEVLVDGVSSGIRFGTGKQFNVKEPLIDGGHTIQVRVQGIYGLWSTPGETSITVQNDPGESIALMAVSNLDTLLTWETDSTVQLTRIYRDGKQIGIAAGFSFRDRVSLGEHSFYVLQELPDGNYTQSNIVVSTSAADMTYIAPASGGEWLPLKLSENSASAQYFTFNRSHSLRHVTGAVFPVVEVAQFQDLSGSYDVAFADLESAKGFESLFGQIVIVKSRGNSVLIGPLVALNKTHNDFYINYTFTIQQIDWEDFVNAADSGL